MKRYNIIGNEIPIAYTPFNKYDIVLSNNKRVHIYTLMNQINVVDFLTENKYKTICNEFGFETTIFRKHIVKITEVK